MRRPFLRLAGALLLGAAGAAGLAHAAGVAPAADDSLYRALGGQAGIAALMSDFAQRLKQDPVIGHFFD
ncbi:MAG: group 1 truncated hemoglobin, partial [Burkholderiales bacterium]|nr:group 1 truncated hemoglobin [Burkholderiales bacterium]